MIIYCDVYDADTLESLNFRVRLCNLPEIGYTFEMPSGTKYQVIRYHTHLQKNDDQSTVVDTYDPSVVNVYVEETAGSNSSSAGSTADPASGSGVVIEV